MRTDLRLNQFIFYGIAAVGIGLFALGYGKSEVCTWIGVALLAVAVIIMLTIRCPNCGQQLRVPRGKGKLSITCRKECGVTYGVYDSLAEACHSYRASRGHVTTLAEKLRKTANAKREERKEFDAFIADMGSPSVTEKKPDEVSVDEDKPTENGVEAKVFFEREALGEKEDDVAIAKEKSAKEQTLSTAALALQESGAGEVTLSSVAGSKAQEPTEDLFELAVNNEAVRLRIIGEYLTSLGKSNAPLTAVGGGTLASPPLKAKTVGEAGNMALLYLRKPNT